MATFDEKEFLYDMHNNIEVLMSKKRALNEDSPKEWLIDFRKLNDFKNQLMLQKVDDINYRDALAFFKAMKQKYQTMPDKW
ncbi:hypothetical protein RHO13_00090 [Orbus wheelerorum]|uniref:hypothetical protein n=1 Tax=Orbus wheelerorum TaxID=3074111 RepID=UPI00370D3FCC